MNRRHRLTAARDFALVSREGSRGSAGALSCAVRDRGDGDPARFGFSVGKQVGSAVERNRIKRRLRAAVEPLLNDIPIGADVVVVARSGVSGKSFQELENDLGRAISKALGRREAVAPC